MPWCQRASATSSTKLGIRSCQARAFCNPQYTELCHKALACTSETVLRALKITPTPGPQPRSITWEFLAIRPRHQYIFKISPGDSEFPPRVRSTILFLYSAVFSKSKPNGEKSEPWQSISPRDPVSSQHGPAARGICHVQSTCCIRNYCLLLMLPSAIWHSGYSRARFQD